jgi:hypothetical protein
MPAASTGTSTVRETRPYGPAPVAGLRAEWTLPGPAVGSGLCLVPRAEWEIDEAQPSKRCQKLRRCVLDDSDQLFPAVPACSGESDEFARVLDKCSPLWAAGNADTAAAAELEQPLVS